MCHPLRRQHCGPVLSCSLFFNGRPVRSAAMPVLFLLSIVENRFFAPQGQHVAPINVKFGTGERTDVYRGRNVGIQPPKLSKFRILTINLPLRGHSFAQFYEILRFYKHL